MLSVENPIFFVLECVFSINKWELYAECLKCDLKEDRNRNLFKLVSSKFDLTDASEDSIKSLHKFIAVFTQRMADKLNACGRVKKRFWDKHYESSKNESVEFKVVKLLPLPSTSEKRSNAGRPPVPFESSSEKTKRRRVEGLVQLCSPAELMTAAEVSTRQSGQRNVASIISDLSKSPTAANVIEKVKAQPPNMRVLTNEEALAYFVEAKLNHRSYKSSREWALKAGHNVYPSWYSLLKAKHECYPQEKDVKVTETRAEINLQAILDLTAARLVRAQNNFVGSSFPKKEFTLISKWGCDGSSGHSAYKQKFENDGASDENLFLFSFVPIKLHSPHEIIWQNPCPSSTSYCRPLKFILAKESTELTISETNKVKDQISKLLPTTLLIDNSEIVISHKLVLTMVDGKVCNSLTNTLSAQRCYICGATPKEMNKEMGNYEADAERFSFGLSTLHAWIRCFECLLHISYRLTLKEKKWTVKNDDDKKEMKLRKNKIQSQFKKDMGLIVDMPKAGGSGTSNDGNTARRFFANAALSSRITGIELCLIENLGFLLQAISSGHEINLEKFEKLALKTRKIYLEHYSWYYMPVTLHKILMHGSEIIKNALLPIGQLSEEAQEARNKDCRRYREHNTRKCGRVATNTDLLNMLLITSDPLINSLRKKPRKKISKHPKEVLDLFVHSEEQANLQEENHSETETESSEDEYSSD